MKNAVDKSSLIRCRDHRNRLGRNEADASAGYFTAAVKQGTVLVMGKNRKGSRWFAIGD